MRDYFFSVMSNGDKICAKKTFYSPQVQRKTVTTVVPAFYHQVSHAFQITQINFSKLFASFLFSLKCNIGQQYRPDTICVT